MYLKLALRNYYFEVFFEERTLGIILLKDSKEVFMYEKYFPKYFKCAVCNEKTEYEGDKLKLCEEHYASYMKFLQKKVGYK